MDLYQALGLRTIIGLGTTHRQINQKQISHPRLMDKIMNSYQNQMSCPLVWLLLYLKINFFYFQFSASQFTSQI